MCIYTGAAFCANFFSAISMEPSPIAREVVIAM
jgi:hypothetical protein